MRLAAALPIFAGILAAAAAPSAKPEGCLECHKGLDAVDANPGGHPSHPSCVSCHRGDPAAGLPSAVLELRARVQEIEKALLEARDFNSKTLFSSRRVAAERELQGVLRPAIDSAHRELIRDPGDPSVVKTTCGACHAHGQVVANHLRSLHATAAGVIRGVRHAYGARGENLAPASALPFPIREENTPKDRPARALESLAAARIPEGGPDALLRLECLSCHAGFSVDGAAHEYYRGIRERGEREQMERRVRAEEARRGKPLAPAERAEFERRNPAPSPPLPPGDPSYFQMPFGTARGAGCAACHFEYHETGLAESGDETVPWHERVSSLETIQARTPEGRFANTDPVARLLRTALRDRERSLTEAFTVHPRRHRIVTKVRTDACLACHHCPFGVGPDFVGRVRAAPASQVLPEAPAFRRIYGSAWAETPPSVHFEKGMSCIDCHRGSDLHGDGTIGRHAGDGVSVRCETCHGTLAQGPDGNDAKGRPFPGLSKKPVGWRLKTWAGSEKTIPLPSERRGAAAGPEAHRIARHERLECYACHAPEASLAYGLRVLEDYGPDATLLEKSRFRWRLDHVPFRLTQDLLEIPARGVWPLKPGRILTETIREIQGAPSLGVNARGRISPIRPGPEIRLTRIDRDGNAAEQGASLRSASGRPRSFRPFTPHGIRRQARACGSCHGNPAAAGIASGALRAAGAQEKTFVDLDAFVRRGPQGYEPAAESWVEGARPLNAAEISNLLKVRTARDAPSEVVFALIASCAVLGLVLVVGRRRRKKA